MQYRLLSPPAMFDAPDLSMEYPVMNVEKLYESVKSKFPGEETLKV